LPTVYIQIEDNANCGPWEGQVFQCQTSPRIVTQVRREHSGVETWCDVTGLSADGKPSPAMAGIIEDSGEGACYLVFGGEWGLRFKEQSSAAGWDLTDSRQWGEPFLILAADDADIRFQ
jgi:hypothetical protein